LRFEAIDEAHLPDSQRQSQLRANELHGHSTPPQEKVTQLEVWTRKDAVCREEPRQAGEERGKGFACGFPVD
jgi:hypothetical protein